MIIVNQDKNVIINFDNINAILATETGKILCFNNTYRSQDDCSEILGNYKTGERAKEVLQKIITRYANWENLKVGQPSGICLPVYEMPKE